MKRSVKDLANLKGKRVLVRVDFNVPIDKTGRITDTTRIKAAIPTIRFLVEAGAKVILLSHWGRPNGFEIDYSMWPISLILLQYFPARVYFSQKTVGEGVKERIESLPNGSVLLLENVRFHKEEELNDKKFIKEIASMGDLFVNEAFSVSHRKHASCYGVSRLLPNAVGFLTESEVETISGMMEQPQKPFVAIFGGFKVESKIKIIENLIDKVNCIIIGGAMAFPFLSVKGINIGASPCTKESCDIAKGIIEKAEAKGVKILLPVDHIAVKLNDLSEKRYYAEDLEGDMISRDIGPKTIELFAEEIKKARQVVWNGPLGMYETQGFKQGTFAIAEAVATSKCYSMVGGGDSISALNESGHTASISHISTGGGASMKMLEGESLPCIEIIQERII